jgi:hypothetical protein
MQPSSFCTICTEKCKNELSGLLFSLSIHHPNATIYIMSDTPTKEYITNDYLPKLNIVWFVELDKYTHVTRADMERMGIFKEFLYSKSVIMDKALEKEPDTLFLDSDIIILDKVSDINNNKKVGLSPGFISKDKAYIYGYYNAGMIWTKDKTMPAVWRTLIKSSRYFEQACIEDIRSHFSYFEFGDNYNLQTWRFIVGEEPCDKIMSYITIDKNTIKYKTKKLKFIHTHFNDNRFNQLNEYFIYLLRTAGYTRELIAISKVIHSKWQFNLSHNSHKWNEQIMVMGKNTKNVKYELTNEDEPTFTFCNIKLKIEIPKNPILFESSIKYLPYIERTYEIYNDITDSKQRIINMSKSKFGISDNINELLAFGTIPIVKSVPPNIKHAFYIISHLDNPTINMTQQEWSIMSIAAQRWYFENIHSTNILHTILDSYFL